jgi:predicted ester cyclase
MCLSFRLSDYCRACGRRRSLPSGARNASSHTTNKNVARADEYIRPAFVDHTPGLPSGLDGAKQGIVGFLTGFPDIHFAIEDQIAEGDKVVARLTMSGTHQGEFAGVPPTGKQVSVTGIDVWRVHNGKCAEHWLALDNLGLMQQLGAIPEPGQAGT